MRLSLKGIVYLVGAGPGAPGLITVRGAQCLSKADVVIYDNLANPELLQYAPEHAEKIYAGKMADQHTKSQDEINALLVDRASSGLCVVRLKGGDPFLFGRGGEEAQWLTEHGIAWEVVPGVTSAIAVPAYAGIPVTHRSVNGSLHIVTGHENVEGIGADIDWSVLARSKGTIVMLMGVKNLNVIAQELISHGMAADTKVAMVQWGTRANQRTLLSQLDCIVDDVAKANFRPPAITIIGNVVSLRESLAWVEKRPLFGMRVAITRPLDENGALAAELEELGAEVFRTPTLKVVSRSVSAASRETLQKLLDRKFDWIVFTSGNGVRRFAQTVYSEGLDMRCLQGAKVAAIGRRTADALKNHGVLADMIAEDSRQEGLADELIIKQPRNVLIARAAIARPHLEDVLHNAGVAVDILPVYETVPDRAGIDRLVELLHSGALNVVTFTSARTFESLHEIAGDSIVELVGNCAVAVIGQVTEAAVKAAGVRVDMVAPRADMAALANVLAEWSGQQVAL